MTVARFAFHSTAIAVCSVLMTCGFAPTVLAVGVTLTWDAPTQNDDGTSLTDLAGYRLYYGQASGVYGQSLDCGMENSKTLSGFSECVTYFFSVRAYNSSGLESSPSVEFVWTPPDVTPPVVTGPASVNLSANSSGKAAVPDLKSQVTVAENCSPLAAVAVTQTPTAGTLVGLGTTVVTVKATDEAGNVGQCSVNVVVSDQTPPTVTGPASVNLKAGSNGKVAVPNLIAQVTVSDNCSPLSAITMSQTPTAGLLVGVGTTVVTVKATDAAGNVGQCTVNVAVADETAPSITGPASVNLVAGSTGKAAVPNLTTQVVVSDNCSPLSAITIAQTPTAGTLVGCGTNTVTVTATDQAGNKGSCAVRVIVADTTPPTISGSTNATVTANGSGRASVPSMAVTVADNCSTVSEIVVAQNPSAGTELSVGVYEVIVTATDRAGNKATLKVSLTVKAKPRPKAPTNLRTTDTLL
jgi:hypothetical protein